MKRIAAFLLALPLSGCFLAQDYLHTPSPSYPYGARWVKAGMTQQSRLADWVACGGGADLSNGFRKWINPEPRQQFFSALNRHDGQLWACMGNRGYLYKKPVRADKPDECTASVCMYP
jgi:hypothetical protein